MSADADRIAFTCPECGRVYGKTGRTKLGMATCCSEQSVRRIAQLTAELDEVTKRCADMATIAERRGKERDAAQAEGYAEWGWHMLTVLYAISVYYLIVMRQGIDWIAILKMSEENRKRADALATRVTLWRSLELLVRGGCTPLDERVGALLRSLDALDADEGTDG